MKFAVIKTGGKQYKVTEGQELKIEKLLEEKGGKVVFNDVLLVDDGKSVKIGTPTIAGAKVEAEVTEQGRAKKITIIKFKPKSNYRKKMGHRQPYTKIKISKI